MNNFFPDKPKTMDGWIKILFVKKFMKSFLVKVKGLVSSKER